MIIVLNSLVELFSIIICLFYFYNKKFVLDLRTIICLVLNVIFMHVMYESNIPIIYTMLFYGVLIIYVGSEFGFNIKYMIVNILLCLLLVALLQLCGIIIYGLLLSDSESSEFMYLIINILVLISVIFPVRKVKIHRVSRFLLERDLAILFVVIYAGTVLIAYLIQYKFSKGMSVAQYIVPMFSIGYMCFLAAFFKKYKASSVQKEAEIRIHNLYIQSYEKLIEDIRSRQHDFDNHLNTIFSQHYVCETYDELIQAQTKYIGELRENNKFNKLLTSGNTAVVGFLYSKFIECEDEGIDISYKVNFNQMVSDIPITTIIELIGNILDNAMEEVRLREKKKIYVYIFENNKKIVIEIRNEADYISHEELSHFFKKGYSSKGKGRGIGLGNVKRICEKYGIDLVCTTRKILDENWISFYMEIKKSMPVE